MNEPEKNKGWIGPQNDAMIFRVRFLRAGAMEANGSLFKRLGVIFFSGRYDRCLGFHY